MTTFRTDVSRSLRCLLREPGYTAIAVLLLSTASAAATLAFAVLDATVFDPLDLPSPERLVVVGTTMPEVGLDLGAFERFSGPEASEIAARLPALRRPLIFDLNSVALRQPDAPLRLFAAYVDADPLATLLVHPEAGRSFTAQEVETNAPVVLLSHELWNRLGAAADLVGTTMVVDGIARTVVGIAPRFARVYGVDLWLPLPQKPSLMPRDRRQLNLLARRGPETDPATLNRELAALASSMEAEQVASRPELRGWGLEALSWMQLNAVAEPADAGLVLLAVAAGLLLSWSNLAGLTIARLEARRADRAVRWALGARAWEGWRPALAEAATVSGLGLIGGLVLIGLGLPLLETRLPAELLPGGRDLALDARVLAFHISTALLAAAVLGLVPLGLARDPVAATDLRGGRGAVGTSVAGHLLSRVVVRIQAALALVVAVGAGLAASSVLREAWAPAGWLADDVVSMRISRTAAGVDSAPVAFFEGLLEVVREWPDVEDATLATQVLPHTLFGAEVQPTADSAALGQPHRTFHTVVGDRYFETLGIPLVTGRSLDSSDRTEGPCSAVVNAVAARRLFGTESAVGRRLRVVGSRFDSGHCEIVGVSAAIPNRGPSEPPAPEVFTAHRQAGDRYRQMFLALRSPLDPPTALVPRIRAALASLDPDQPLYAVTTGSEALAEQLATRRATAVLLCGVATACLLLAGFGIHGLVRYRLQRRRRELGLRMALGASRRILIRGVLFESLRTVAPGVAAGAFLAGVGSLVAPVDSADIWRSVILWIVGAGTGLVAVAVAASLGPALRAAARSPARELREP